MKSRIGIIGTAFAMSMFGLAQATGINSTEIKRYNEKEIFEPLNEIKIKGTPDHVNPNQRNNKSKKQRNGKVR